MTNNVQDDENVVLTERVLWAAGIVLEQRSLDARAKAEAERLEAIRLEEMRVCSAAEISSMLYYQLLEADDRELTPTYPEGATLTVRHKSSEYTVTVSLATDSDCPL